MKKTLILLLALLLVAAPALAASSSVVNDAAGVLDPGLISGIQKLNEETQRKLDIRLQVITRHFLGGAQAASFAEETRQNQSESPENTILLVMVIGEERYAISMGEVPQALLGLDAVNNLLASTFRAPYLNRDYDGALRALISGLVVRMESASGQRLSSKELFDSTPSDPSMVPDPTRAPNPLDSFFREWERSSDNAKQYEQNTRDRGRSRLSLWQIALIGFILFKLFGRDRTTGRKRGCGPLGWIFGTWGISKFFGWRK